MVDTIITGTEGNDVLSGGNGKNTIHGLGGNDILYGGNGIDHLFGDGGNDQLIGGNGTDYLNGGAGDDLIDGKAGVDIAYYSGIIGDYSFFTSAGYLHILHQGGAGADGHDQLINVEQLVFADRVIDLGSGKNVPVAGDDQVSTNEDVGVYSSGAASVLANDYDFDGDPMTVTGGVFVGAYGTLTLNANGTYSYALAPAAQTLAQGETGHDSFNYVVTDNDGSDTGALVFHITGVNDAPVAHHDTATGGENQVILIDVLTNDEDVDNNRVLTLIAASAASGQGSVSVVGNQIRFDPGSDFEDLAVGQSRDVQVGYTISDEHGATASSTVTVTVTGANDGPVANADTGTTGENVTLLLNVLGNDTDMDNGAVLTVTSASAPAGKGHASVVGNQLQFDPGTDFDDLAVGDSEEVLVSYTMSDEHGATSSSTATILVIGANDAPMANADTRSTLENSSVVIDVLGNDTDADREAVLVVTSVSAPPAGQGTVSIVENQIRFEPGGDFDYLASGESAQVVLNYTIEDEWGVSSSSTVTITVNGRTEGTGTTGTAEGETLTGTAGDDTIDALGGDDIVFGLAGADLVTGGDGNDQLDGGDDDDTLEGGTGNDTLLGGDGNDQLAGETDNDRLQGGDGSDQLAGGAGLDFLRGDAGDDVLEGGDDDDYLFGDEGEDQLSGGAGADGLDGGDGDDQLSGGAGNDSLSDTSGANSFLGGLGDDFISAGSPDGAQTIDSGDGNDTIRHIGRHFAGTIATGAGSDTVALLGADLGTAQIVITDFTPGAGGDKLELSGGEDALLSLLTDWDGTSNPFSSGFLRLQQSDADTVLQWDRDGDTNGSDWQTLIVFENTTVAAFTAANFVPGYAPDGAAPAGQTTTGTIESDVLTGTIGADTMSGLAESDSISGLAGDDSLVGGDGFDFLYGGAGNDSLDGGNDDDLLFGDEGDDELSGGAGDDTLTDTSGANTLLGGTGDDFISAGSADGIQTVDGGDGTDTIVITGRGFASAITTGAGRDTLGVLEANVGTAAVTVSDFTTGDGGDVFQLVGGEGSLLSLLSGWDGSSNPFETGFLRLQQSDADSVLQWDSDGTGTDSDWETLVVFQGTTVGAFTAANFAPGYNPDGSALAGQTITGTAEGDTLVGTIAGDTIAGLGGDDSVFGQAGADVIQGGDGSDFLLGEGDDDTIAGGNDDDFVIGGAGEDQLSGDAGKDALLGEDGNDSLSGGDGDDSLDGGSGDDTLGGGIGDDFLSGGMGADALTGGGGGDVFFFQAPSLGADEIADFVSGTDRIGVSSGRFGGGLSFAGAVSLVSGADPTASSASGQFLYDTDNGHLMWDADGTGSGAAVHIATLGAGTALNASDFVVYF